MYKRHKLGLLSLGVILSCLVFFQNCGQNNESSAGDELINSLDNDYKQSKSINAAVGDDVTLEAPAKSYSEFEFAGECEWTFTNSNQVVAPIANASGTLTLMNVKKAQSGVYLLHCQNSTKNHKIEFKLFVDGGAVTSDKATYKGYYIFAGKSKIYADKDNVLRATALDDCKAKYNAKKKIKGIKCLWGTETIFKEAEPTNTKGVLKIYALGSDKKYALKKTVKDLKLAEAKKQCTKYADGTKAGIKCTWEGEEIAVIAADKGPKHDAKGCFVTSNKGHTAACKTFKAVAEADAKSKCVSHSNSVSNYTKLGYGYSCKWNGKEIYKRDWKFIYNYHGGHD